MDEVFIAIGLFVVLVVLPLGVLIIGDSIFDGGFFRLSQKDE